MGTDFGSEKDEGGIQVDDCVTCGFYAGEGFLKKDGGVGILPLRVGGWKERADVGAGDGSEERVGDGVEENVAVGMASETVSVGQGDAADSERDGGLEFVGVPTVADAHFWFQFLFPLLKRLGLKFTAIGEEAAEKVTCRERMPSLRLKAQRK